MNIPPDGRIRVLVTVNPFESHVRGLVTLVTTLGELGHDVRIAVPDGWSEWLRDYGVTTVGIGPMWLDPKFATVVFGALLDGGAKGFDRTLITEFTSPRFVSPVVEGVLALAEHWRPHVVVHECTEFGGYLAAEVLGIPHVVVDIGSMEAIAQGLHEEVVRPALTALRSRLGLGPEPETPGIQRHLTVTMTPERFNHEDFAPPLARYRHEFPVRHDERLPTVFARLPEDRPVVYLSMGSIGPLSSRFMQRSTEIYREVFTALGALECSVIAALPTRYEPLFPSLPPHVHTMPWVPQSLVLEHVDLFITHGGLNSIRDAITSGAPQVIMPFFADHPGNARRCELLGTGIAVDPTTVTAAEVLSACERVLAAPSYRRETEELGRHMRALPPQTAFAGDLALLIEKHSAGEGVR